MQTGSDLDWYILATQPRAEMRVEQGLALRGVTRFVPRYSKVVRQNRERRFVERMLIPGYVFVGLERGREPWQRVRETPGVIGFVYGLDYRPWRIKAVEIGDLMSKCSFSHFDEERRRIGCRIRFSTVKIGPLISRHTAHGRIVALEQDGMVRVLMHGAQAPTFEKMRLDEFALA